MDDLISRRAAIDAFTDEIQVTGRSNAESIKAYVKLVIDRIKRLPSAQPEKRTEERAETHACDCISREAAIEAMRKAKDKSEAHRMLMQLPPAQPEQRWIPCSERLPEDGENVLVTYKTTDKIHPCQYHDDGSRNPWYSYIDQCRAHMNVVLAWMPLPEPYQEERREDG